jgi:hypothetical protein
MEDVAMTEADRAAPRRMSGDFDLGDLLHPARAFAHPRDVVHDPDLTCNEKRAILASWASDARAIEAAPALRQGPSTEPVSFDDVMDALRALDQAARSGFEAPRHYRRVLEKRAPGVFGRKSRGNDPNRHGPAIN